MPSRVCSSEVSAGSRSRPRPPRSGRSEGSPRRIRVICDRCRCAGRRLQAGRRWPRALRDLEHPAALPSCATFSSRRHAWPCRSSSRSLRRPPRVRSRYAGSSLAFDPWRRSSGLLDSLRHEARATSLSWKQASCGVEADRLTLDQPDQGGGSRRSPSAGSAARSWSAEDRCSADSGHVVEDPITEMIVRHAKPQRAGDRDRGKRRDVVRREDRGRAARRLRAAARARSLLGGFLRRNSPTRMSARIVSAMPGGLERLAIAALPQAAPTPGPRVPPRNPIRRCPRPRRYSVAVTAPLKLSESTLRERPRSRRCGRPRRRALP